MPANASSSLHALARDVAAIPRTAMTAAAKAAKDLADNEGSRLAGSDGMKGTKRRGVQLRARADVQTTSTGTTCRVQGTVAGWVWMNSGTRPHTIPRRKKGPKHKLVVHHPGMPGRHAWDRVSTRIADLVPDIFGDETHRVVSGG